MGYDGTLKFDTQVNTKGFESGANQITNLANGAVKGLSSILTKATSALTGLGKSVVQVGTQFETSMSNVAAISGATGDELDALTKKAQEMGAKTKFSASESADAFSYMAMAGWKTEEMLGGIKGIMNLAAASGEDLATTSDIVTDALTAFGLKAKDSGHFADILAAASSNANTNVGLMGETFKYVAPVAGALGFSAEDTAQAIGLMANAGIKGSQAGTALRSVFSRLAKPTKQSQQALDDLGLSLTDDAGNVKDLNTLLLEMRQKFSTLSDAQKANYAALLAGQEGMSGLLAIVNASDADWNKLAGAIDGCTDELTGYSAAEEMAAKQIDNLEGQVTILKSSLEGLKIKLYQGVETPLKEIVKGVQGMVQQLTDAFDKGGFDGLVSAVGDVLSQAIDKIAKAAPKFINMAVSLVHSFCEGLTKADGIAETSASLVSAVIKGIMSVVGDIVTTANYLIVELVKGMETHLPDLLQTGIDIVLNIINGAVQTIPQLLPLAARIIGTLAKTLVSNIPRITDAVINIVSAIIDGITAAAPELLNAAIELFSSIAEALPVIKTKLISALNNIIGSLAKNISTAVPKLTKSIKSLISSIAAALPDILKSFTGIVLDIIQQILDIIIDIAPELLNCITEVIISLVSALPDLLEMLVEAIPDVLSSIGEAIIALTPKILESVTQVIKAIAKALPNIIISIIDVLPSVVDNIIKTLLGMLPELIKAGTTLLSSLVDGLPTAIDNIVDKMVDIVDSIVDKLLELLPQLVECGIDIILNLISGFNKALPNLLQSVTGIVVKLAESLAQNAPKIAAAASDIANALIDGLTSALPQLLEAVMNILSSIVDVLPELIKQIADAMVELAPVIIDGVLQIITALVEALPEFITAVAKILPELITAVVDVLPELIDSVLQAVKECLPQLLDGIIKIVDVTSEALIDSLPILVEATLQLFEELIDFILMPETISKIVEMVSKLVINVSTALLAAAPKLLVGVGKIIKTVIDDIIKTDWTEVGKKFSENINAALKKASSKLSKWWDGWSQEVARVAVIEWNKVVEVWSSVGQWFADRWQDIKDAFTNVADWFVNIFSSAWEGITNAWNGVVEFFSGIWNGIKNAFGAVTDWFKSVFFNAWEGIKIIWGGVTNFFAGIWNGIKNTFSAISEWFKSIFSNAWNGIKSIWNGVTNFFTGIWNGIKNVFSMVADWFKNIFSNAWNGIKSIWNGVVGFFSGIWEGIKNTFVSVGNWFKNIFSGAWEEIKNAWNGVVEFFSGIWNGIKNAFGAVADWFRNIFSKAWEAVKNVFSTGGKIFDGIKDGIVIAFKAVVNAIIRGINKVVAIPFNAINGILDGIRNVDIAGIKPFDWIVRLDVPQIPELARGGVLKKGQVGLLEGDGAEAVVPLEHNTEWIKKVADQITKEMQSNIHTESIIISLDKEVPQKKEQTINTLQKIADNIIESGMQATNALKNIFSGLDIVELDFAVPEIDVNLDGLSDSVQNEMDKTKNTVQNTVDDISSYLDRFRQNTPAIDYINTLLSGDIEDVTNEFQDDISRAVSWLYDNVSNFSDVLVDDVKEFFETQLPSSLFHDEISENFVLELTDGITDNATAATETLQALQDTYDGLSIGDIEITVSYNGADITRNLLESLSEFGTQAAETIQDVFNGLDAIEIDVEKTEISCDFDSLAEGIKDDTETAKAIVQQTIDDINSFFSGFIPEKRTEDYLDRMLSNNDLKQSFEAPDFLKNAREVVSRITGEIQATVNTEASKIAYDKTAPQEYEQSRNDRRSQADINVTGQLESDRPIEVHTVLYLDKRKLAEEITPAVNHEMYKIDQRENNRGRGN